MDYLHAFYLALLQGLTEFLPISSSAHLILMPALFNWEDQGLAFDLAVHLGTLIAVIGFFRTQVRVMFRDWLASLTGKSMTEEARLAWYVVIGTIPVCTVGLLTYCLAENAMRSPLVIAGATIIFAGVLWVATHQAKQNRPDNLMNWKDGLIIGAFQVLALIPGTSRSGITITAGLLLGFKSEFVARFSFLLSIPAILFPGLVKSLELINFQGTVDWGALLIGVLVSAVIAYLTIGLFLKLLDRIGLMPFVIYRFVLGAGLLAVFL